MGRKLSKEEPLELNPTLWNAGSFIHKPKLNSRKVNWQERNCRAHFNASDKLFMKIIYYLDYLSP